MTRTFAVDDEFGNQITCGLASYDAAKQVAKKYMVAHRRDLKGPVRIYESGTGGESWDVTLANLE